MVRERFQNAICLAAGAGDSAMAEKLQGKMDDLLHCPGSGKEITSRDLVDRGLKVLSPKEMREIRQLFKALAFWRLSGCHDGIPLFSRCWARTRTTAKKSSAQMRRFGCRRLLAMASPTGSPSSPRKFCCALPIIQDALTGFSSGAMDLFAQKSGRKQSL